MSTGLDIVDKKIIESIVSDDADELRQTMRHMYERCFGATCQYVLNNKGTREEAQDVFQDALIALFLNVKKGAFRAESSINTYVYGISKRLWLKNLNKQQVLKPVEQADAVLFSEQIFNFEHQLSVNKLLLKIDERCRSILKDFYYEKLSVSKLMQKYDIASEGATKNKKYKCLQKLVKIVNENNLKRDQFNNE